MRMLHGAGGAKSCFAGTTLVTMSDGSKKAIIDIRVGDRVLGFNFHGELVEQTVTETMHHEEPGQLLAVSYWGGVLLVTRNHWVLNQYNTFAPIGSLEVGEDALIDRNGHLRPVSGISEFGPQKTFNLTVVPDHTFIADDIRVHNGGLGVGAPIGGAGGKPKDKGGGGQYTPTESPDTLRSKSLARVIHAISEGPVKGPVGGGKAIVFDGVPLQNPDNSYNYPNTKVQFRQGIMNQYPITGYTDVETEFNVQEEVKSTTNRIAAIHMISQGSGYTWATVTIDPPTGNPGTGANENPVNTSQATAFAVLGPGGTIQQIVVYLPGANYITYPNVTITGDGTGAAAWADLGGGVVRTITDPEVDAVRIKVRVGNFLEQTEKGDVLPTHTYLMVQVRADGGHWQQTNGGNGTSVITIQGKTTSGYEESYRFDLPPGGAPWQIRVVKIKSDSVTSRVQDSVQFSSYTTLIDAKMMYMDTAVVGIEMDSEYFPSGVPRVGFDYEGLIIRVPSNYDAANKTYSGIWDGTFKLEYTNNPVWCFLDLLTNDRYGLGQWVDDTYLDFSTFYQMAKYCDQLVPDGKGGLEPRFTFNTQILNQEEAYNVLNLIASVFRGMIFWASGWVSASQDSPADVSRLVMPANTINGEFAYQGTSRKARHSVAIVTWNDPDNQYQRTVDIYEDPELIARYGYIETEVTAYGCTSRGQAIRMAKWILDSERYATDVITYKAGWDHADARPGEVIAVSDPARSLVRQGGRVTAYQSRANLIRSSGLLVDSTQWFTYPTQFTYLHGDPARTDPWGGFAATKCTWTGVAGLLLFRQYVTLPLGPYRPSFWVYYPSGPARTFIFNDNATSLSVVVNAKAEWQRIVFPVFNKTDATKTFIDFEVSSNVAPFWFVAPQLEPGSLDATDFIATPPTGGKYVFEVVMDESYDFNTNENYQITAVIPTWGRVTASNGSAVITGTRTKFTSGKPILPGDTIIFEKQSKQYVVASVGGSTTLTLTEPYYGFTLVSGDFMVIRAGKLLYASLNNTIDIPLENIGPGRIARLASAPPDAIMVDSPFMITGTDVAPQKYRIVSNKETEKGVFEITALEYDPTKYDRVEYGLTITQPPTWLENKSLLKPPSNLTVGEGLYRSNNQVRSRVMISWMPAADARVSMYQVQFRNSQHGWRTLALTPETTVEMIDADPDLYEFSVKSMTPIGAPSVAVYQVFRVYGKTAPPGDVQNFTANRTVNGVQLSWDEAEDLDVVGYEIREGLSWAEGIPVTLQQRGTTIFIQLFDALQHSYHIKAVDDLGNLSVNPASLTAGVVPPPDVSGFSATPDNDRLIFRWKRAEGQDIKYEIRYGESFGSGTILGQFDGTDANVMFPVEGDKMFWIKAISSVGLYSISAANFTISIRPIQSRNVILENDRAAVSWTGTSYRVEPAGIGNSELKITDGYLSGDHLFQIIVSPDEAVRARCWFDTELLMDAGSPTWAEAGFTWASPEGLNAWRPLGDFGVARADVFIAINNGEGSIFELETWPFATDLAGLRNNTLPEPGSGTYQSGTGVTTDGFLMTDNQAKLTYEITVPSQFSLRKSFVISSPATHFGAEGTKTFVLELLKLVGPAGRWLRLLYTRHPAGRFVLQGSDQTSDIVIDQPGNSTLRVTLAIVQTASERRLYLYNHDSTLSTQQVITIPTVGGYSEIQV